MNPRDEELTLLGVLEASLGDRQRALSGLHVDEQAVRETLSEMLDIERRIDEQTTERAAAEQQAPRHRKPRRLDAAFGVAGVLFLLALAFVLWQV
jgi:hypothetical protein